MTQKELEDMKKINNEFRRHQHARREQLTQEIILLSAKIPKTIRTSTPVELQKLLFRIDGLKSDLISVQNYFIDLLSGQLQSESDRVDRAYGVTK